MLTKILYRVYVIGMNDEIEYNDDNGTIYINFMPVHKRQCVGNLPFYYFKLIFDSYSYQSKYYPEKNSVQKNVTGKRFHLYFYLNIDTILLEKHNSWMYHKLKFYFTQLQIKQIVEKKNFKINVENCKTFINAAEKKHLFLIPWYMYQINNKYVINLKENDNNISLMNHVAKLLFNKKGGIIETNSPTKMIFNNFINDCKNDFIILPKSMSQMWKNSDAHIMTYDELIRIKKNSLQKITTKKWKRLIIHECHQQFLVCIKNLIKKINCDIVWVINALPLCTYFFKGTDTNLCSTEVRNLLEIWTGQISKSTFKDFDKKYRNEIDRFIFTNFRAMYARINYDSVEIEQHSTIYPNQFEKNIINELNIYYERWKNNLTNDKNNKYSSVTKKKLNIINNNLFNAIMTLSLSITDKQNLKRFITSKINKMLTELKRTQKILTEIVDEMVTHPHFSLNMEPIENIIEEDNKKIVNYARYLTDENHFIDKDDKTTCPICYESFTSGSCPDRDVVKINLICDHHICMECMFRSLTNNNECPICREHITINEMVIVQETISNYSSELANFFKNMDKYTIILSEFPALENAMHNFYGERNNLPEFFNLDDKMIMGKIRKLSNIKKIYIITSNCIMYHKYLTNYVGYFNSFNVKPNIMQINIPIL